MAMLIVWSWLDCAESKSEVELEAAGQAEAAEVNPSRSSSRSNTDRGLDLG
jgi:hypothetical protein